MLPTICLCLDPLYLLGLARSITEEWRSSRVIPKAANDQPTRRTKHVSCRNKAKHETTLVTKIKPGTADHPFVLSHEGHSHRQAGA